MARLRGGRTKTERRYSSEIEINEDSGRYFADIKIWSQEYPLNESFKARVPIEVRDTKYGFRFIKGTYLNSPGCVYDGSFESSFRLRSKRRAALFALEEAAQEGIRRRILRGRIPSKFSLSFMFDPGITYLPPRDSPAPMSREVRISLG